MLLKWVSLYWWIRKEPIPSIPIFLSTVLERKFHGSIRNLCLCRVDFFWLDMVALSGLIVREEVYKFFGKWFLHMLKNFNGYIFSNEIEIATSCGKITYDQQSYNYANFPFRNQCCSFIRLPLFFHLGFICAFVCSFTL